MLGVKQMRTGDAITIALLIMAVGTLNMVIITKNEKIKAPNSPASFNVMLNYLRGLALDINLKKSK